MSGKNSEVQFGVRVDGSGENGEFVVHTDFQNLQRFLKVHVNDFVLGERARLAYDDGAMDRLWVPGDGAYPYFSAAGRVGNTAGVILQRTGGGDPGGSTPKFLAYYFDTDEIAQVIGSNASGDPRIDGIYLTIGETNATPETRNMKSIVAGEYVLSSQSFYKRRTVQVTVSTLQGTPAASPVVPATPANAALWCSVYVPAGYATGGAIDIANLRDHRMSLGRYESVVTGKNFGFVSTTWNLDSGGLGAIVGDGGGARPALAMPGGGRHHRLVRVGLAANFQAASGGTVKLVRVPFSTPDTHVELLDLTADLASAGSGLIFRSKSLIDEVPIWANGYSAGPAGGNLAEGSNESYRLGLKVTTGATHQDVIHWAEFVFAGG